MLTMTDRQIAFTANEQGGRLHRELITVGECQDANYADEDEMFMTQHQGDNYTEARQH